MNLSHHSSSSSSSSIQWTIALQVSWETQLYHLISRFVYLEKIIYAYHSITVKTLFSISLEESRFDLN
jgi:hypothetical protein